MINNLFSIGTIFKVSNNEELFIVSSLRKDRIKASGIRSNEPLALTLLQAQELIDNNKITFQKDVRTQKGISFENLAQEEQKLALKKLKLLQLLKEQRIIKISGTEKTKQAILELSIEAGFSKPPHWQAVRNWSKGFHDAGQKIKGLYSDKKLRGNPKHRLSKIVEDIITEEIDKFISPSQPRVSSLCRSIEVRILDYNINNPLNVQKNPSRNTIVKRLNQVDLERKQKAKKGKSAYALELANSIAPYSTTQILERVEIDHTPLDIHLLHDIDLTLMGRPNLTVLIDRYSGMVLGYQLSFEAPSFAAVSSACLNAFLQKEDYLKRLKIIGNWPAHGIPQTLITDNGNEFWSNNFSSIGMQLGMIIQYAPIRKPNYKGSVERFFNTINTLLLDDLPGVVRKAHFSNKDYDARKHAQITFSKFESIFLDWIVNTYHNLPNDEGFTPKELWDNSVNNHPIPPEDNLEIELALLATHKATLSGNGISFLGLKYNSEALKSLFRREGKHKVDFKVNPFDIGEILVLDAKELVYIKSPCLEYSYAKGVSVYQHREHKRLARNFKRQKLEKEDLIHAKIKLQKQKDEIRNQNSRRKTQVTTQKHSRIEQVGVPSFNIDSFLTEESNLENEIPENEIQADDWDIE